MSAPCTEIEGLAGTAVITFPVDSGSRASGAASCSLDDAQNSRRGFGSHGIGAHAEHGITEGFVEDAVVIGARRHIDVSAVHVKRAVLTVPSDTPSGGSRHQPGLDLVAMRVVARLLVGAKVSDESKARGRSRSAEAGTEVRALSALVADGNEELVVDQRSGPTSRGLGVHRRGRAEQCQGLIDQV